MKMRMKKKYGLGTGTEGYLESPSDTLADYNFVLEQAQARNQSNPLIPILQGATGLVSSLATKGLSSKPMAAYGKSFIEGEVEVEGGEMVETPQGEAVEIKGPKHEQGGVDVKVPEGTNVFSDRVMTQGKTMAERKARRDKKLSNLEKLLENPDRAIMNTAKRTKDSLDKEEQEDLRVQEMANMFSQMKEEMEGSGQQSEEKQKFGDGAPPGGIKFGKGYTSQMFKPYMDHFQSIGKNPTDPFDTISFQKTLGNTEDGVLGKNDFTKARLKYDTRINFLNEGAASTVGLEEPMKKSFVEPTGVMAGYEKTYQENKLAKENTMSPNTDYSPTIGDMTGLIGNAISTFAPLKNTLRNRAGDTRNINPFEDFGKEALAVNDSAKDLIAGQKANQERKVLNQATSTKRAGRNSARGVNTMRAFDLGVDMSVNDANLNIEDAFSKQMMQNLSEQSQLENIQDKGFMEGEQERDLNDRKDRDNFYTQRGKDMSTVGQGVQQTGKDINTILKNPMYMNLLNDISKYFTMLPDGTMVNKITPKTRK